MSCGQEEKPQPAPTRTLRNGLDYVPPKTYPPDYSNVPSVRDWQMSPFSNERYDLDELQRLEKKGVKGQLQLALLKKQAEEEERKRNQKKERESCMPPIHVYQPYGPHCMPSRPDGNPSYQCRGCSMPDKNAAESGKHKSQNVANYTYVPYGPALEIKISPESY